jgi:UTP--glucose-1-phosphate uridylyltransferase
MSKSKLKQAVFPVAGLGSRFLPVTKSIPKEMLPIIDKPLIQFAVEEAIGAGIEEIIFVTSHTKKAIEDYFSMNYELEHRLENAGKSDFVEIIHPKYLDEIKFSFIRQSEPNGLGHAILQAKHIVTDDFFGVILADDLILSETGCLKQLLKIHERTQSSVLGVFSASENQLSNYGVISSKNIDGFEKVDGIVEKPQPAEAPSNLAVFGRYILSKDIFSNIEQTKPGLNNEIQLTDAIQELISNKDVFALEFEGRRYDCGSKEGYISAIIDRAASIDKYKSIIEK